MWFRAFFSLKTSVPTWLAQSKLIGVSEVVEFTRCVQNVSDWDLLNLFLPDSDSEMELEVIWLMSSYVIFVWENIFVKKNEINLEQFFGFLTYKLASNVVNLHPNALKAWFYNIFWGGGKKWPVQ